MTGRIRLFAILLVPSLVLISCSIAPYKCTDPLGCLEIPAGSPVRIGAILATDGPMHQVGTACMDGIVYVIKNKKTVLGHVIELEQYSTDGTPESAVTSATEMATDPTLLAVIGPSLNGEELVTSPILSEAGIVSLSPVPDPLTAINMTNQIIAAIVQVSIIRPDNTLIVPRQALWTALIPSR